VMEESALTSLDSLVAQGVVGMALQIPGVGHF